MLIAEYEKEVQKGNGRSRSRPQALACYAPFFSELTRPMFRRKPLHY